MIEPYKIEELKNGLRTYVNSITTPDTKAGHDFYKCPICNSGYGKGKKGKYSGAFSIYDNGRSWKCFSCNRGGDLFDLIGIKENIQSFSERIKRAAEVSGMSINIIDQAETKRDQTKEIADLEEWRKKSKAYIEACKKNIGKTDYFKGRGFTAETIKRFNLGYDEKKKEIVIPYGQSGGYYITRSTTGKRFSKPKTSEAGAEPVFNAAALSQNKPCFVCESPIDAISIMQAGGGICTAVSIGGTGSRKLTEKFKKQPPKCVIVLSFDNDEPGEQAAKQAAAELEKLNIPYIKAEYSLKRYPEDKQKDCNDYLIGNPEQLSIDVMDITEKATGISSTKRLEALEAYKKNNGLELIKDFTDGIKDKANTVYIPTGFSQLDEELDGGLYAGLYILGAVSSLGKTTFMLQAADQIAEMGRPVFYYSLEMSATELISKSISRHTFNLCNGETRNAKTSRGITTLSRYRNYSKKEKALIGEAIEKFRSYAGNLFIFEGIGDIGVQQIRADVSDYKSITGEAPVIFIDYLQILQPSPEDKRATDKMIADKTVLELKRLSRDLRTPIFAISSFNRVNYNTEVDMSAFKESGSIEYGSDVLLALQPSGMKPGYKDSDKAENSKLVKSCRASKERKVEAVILKNRNGQVGGKVAFTYYALFNCFNQSCDLLQLEASEADILNNPFTDNGGIIK